MESSQKGVWVRPPGGTWHAVILFWSFVILVGLVYPHFYPEKVEVIKIMRMADMIACAFFFVDVMWRWMASPHKLKFWALGWIDLVSSIPYMPWLRWGRIMSVIRIIRAARSSERILGFFFASRFNSVLMTSGILLFTSIWLSSVFMLHVEDHVEGATIKTAFDALWWSIDTVSTVGYGTIYPVSHAGKIIAMFLMMTGISLFSVNSGLWATWIIRGMRAEGDKLRALKKSHIPASAEVPQDNPPPAATKDSGASQ